MSQNTTETHILMVCNGICDLFVIRLWWLYYVFFQLGCLIIFIYNAFWVILKDVIGY